MTDTTTASAAHAGTIRLGPDLTVNRLGFGAMRITGSGIWGPPADPDEARAVLRRAVTLGVNFIDTADAYGPDVSETLIAEALAPYPDDLVIATKGGLLRSGPNRWSPDGRPEHLKAACEASLGRLGVDQIAVYQWHRPDPAVPLEDSVGALVELKEQGKIRHIGVCNVDEEQLRRAQSLTPVVSVQNRYNLGDRGSDGLVDLCEQEHMAFLPWAPIQDLDRAPAVVEIARRHGAATRQVALAWQLSPDHPRCFRSPGPARSPIWRTTSQRPPCTSTLTRWPLSRTASTYPRRAEGPCVVVARRDFRVDVRPSSASAPHASRSRACGRWCAGGSPRCEATGRVARPPRGWSARSPPAPPRSARSG